MHACIYKTNPQSHAEKPTNYETMEAEDENWALLQQGGEKWRSMNQA